MRILVKKFLIRLLSNRKYFLKFRRISFFFISSKNYTKELWFNDILSNIPFSPNNTFIDVGANVGQTLFKFISTHKHGQYIGFEPNPNCLHVLQNIVKDNHLERCSIIPTALSNQSGLIHINTSKSDLLDSGATIVENFRENSNSTTKSYVPVFPLDSLSYLLEGSRLKVVKIDVEGAENEVLEGGSMIFDKYKPILIIEVLPSYSSENTFRIDRQKWVYDFIMKKGYEVFQIMKDSSPLSLKRIHSFPVHNNVELSDYLCVHSQDKSVIENYKVV